MKMSNETRVIVSIKGPKFLWAFSKNLLSRFQQKFCLQKELHPFSLYIWKSAILYDVCRQNSTLILISTLNLISNPNLN